MGRRSPSIPFEVPRAASAHGNRRQRGSPPHPVPQTAVAGPLRELKVLQVGETNHAPRIVIVLLFAGVGATRRRRHVPRHATCRAAMLCLRSASQPCGRRELER